MKKTEAVESDGDKSLTFLLVLKSCGSLYFIPACHKI